MRNVIIILAFLIFGLSVNADMTTLRSKDIKYYGIGILNLPGSYTVYKEPDKNSEVIFEYNPKKEKQTSIIKKSTEKRISYIASVPSSKISILSVDTDNDDGWYCVYLNKYTGTKGWIYTEDKNSFYTYKSLFYKFGKKYGLRMFNDLPEEKKVLYAKESENSQKLEQLSHPRFINLILIRGNWMLVAVNDSEKQAKIGWYKWRNDDGSLNVLPNFKEQI